MIRTIALAAVFVGWSSWPWLRPMLWPASGVPLQVVLDGYHRLDHALARERDGASSASLILLITCPATGQPTPQQRALAQNPLLVLQRGSDTAEQAVAFAQWLQQRSPQEHPQRIALLSDQHHFPRAAWVFQLAAGGYGTWVQAVAVDTDQTNLPQDHSTWRRWIPTWRDVLRLQLWRLTGTTGGGLAPVQHRRKLAACNLP